MKFCRFIAKDSSAPRFGILHGDAVAEIGAPPWAAAGRDKTGKSFELANVKLLAPVVPSKLSALAETTRLTPPNWQRCSQRAADISEAA